MKRFLMAGILVAGLSAFGGEPLVKTDFKTVKTFEESWSQADGSYYKPLGKIEKTDAGLLLATNDKTENMLVQKQCFPAKVGDQLEIKLKVKCERDTAIFLGAMEYQDKSFVKSDIQLEWVKAPGGEISKLVTLKEGKSPFNSAASCFGVAKGHSAIIETVSAEPKAPEASAGK